MAKKTDIVTSGYNYKGLDKPTRLIVQEHTAAIHNSVRRMARDIWEIGKALIEVKANLKHGQYEIWLRAEFGWSEDTALNFVNVAKRFPVLPDGVEIAPTALYLLAGKKVPEAARLKAVELAESGEKITTERAKQLIVEHTELKKQEIQKPNNSGFKKPNNSEFPSTDELLKSDWNDVEDLIKSGRTREDAIMIMIDLRRKWKRENAEKKAARQEKESGIKKEQLPPFRLKPSIKNTIAITAVQEGKSYDEFLEMLLKEHENIKSRKVKK